MTGGPVRISRSVDRFALGSFSCLNKHKARGGCPFVNYYAGRKRPAQSSGLLQCRGYSRMRRNASSTVAARRSCADTVRTAKLRINVRATGQFEQFGVSFESIAKHLRFKSNTCGIEIIKLDGKCYVKQEERQGSKN